MRVLVDLKDREFRWQEEFYITPQDKKIPLKRKVKLCLLLLENYKGVTVEHVKVVAA